MSVAPGLNEMNGLFEALFTEKKGALVSKSGSQKGSVKKQIKGLTKVSTQSGSKKGFKENIKSKAYTEEPVVRDATWNIFQGNPGIYVAGGDTLYFGNIHTLSDSAFIASLHPVAKKSDKPYGFEGKPIKNPGADWVLGLLLVLWIIFATVRVKFLRYLGQLFKSLINYPEASRLYRQKGYQTMYGAVRLDIIFYTILPLSCFQIARFFGLDMAGYPNILLFIGFFLVLNAFIFIKIFLYRAAGSIVMLRDQTDELIHNIRLYFKAIAVLLLPVASLHAILPVTNFVTIWIMGGVIGIMYLASLLRSIYLGFRKDVSIFYLILYLCTLEILPLLLVAKLMIAR